MGNPNVVDILHMEVSQNLPYWLSPEVKDAHSKAKIRAFVKAKRAKPKRAEDKAPGVRWVESEHPRGQPQNAGEFTSAGGGGGPAVRHGGKQPSGEQQPTKVSLPSGSAAFLSMKQAHELRETLRHALSQPAERQPNGEEQPIKAELPSGGVEYMTRKQAKSLHDTLWNRLGGSPDSPPVELQSVPADAFVKARDKSTKPEFLSPHPAEELADHKLLMNKDGTVGVSVDPKGDIQNVFNNGGPKGAGAMAMVAAILAGGKTLDCYDGFLPSFYHQFGFEEDQRMKFNPDFAPPGWDFSKRGQPDIVFMSLRHHMGSEGVSEALDRAADHEHWTTPERSKVYGNDWDAAKERSRAAAAAADAGRTEAPRDAGAGAGSEDDPAGSLSVFGAGALSRRTVAADAQPTGWRGLLSGLLKLFIEDKPEPVAAGVAIFCRPDHDGTPMRVLLLRRSPDEENYAGYWSLPGGHIDEDETPEQAVRREASEEIGWIPGDLKVLDQTDKYVTYCAFVDDEFAPMLNSEHTDYQWCPLDNLPKPVHPGVRATLEGTTRKVADDSLPVTFAMDRLVVEAQYRDTFPVMANDFESARSLDVDGKMHVAMTHISKACVSPYLGSEIPDCLKLGLDPKKVYHLLRDPSELAKAAATSNRMQVLIKHEPVNAADYKPSITVGATGSDATFNAPYLDNSMVIWSQKAIDKVLDGEQEELSSSYRYTPDMTPGVYEGVPFDGVMRGIVFNHVALVKKGRAGPDVVVADEAMVQQQETEMPEAVKLSRIAARTQAALTVYLMPKLAKDAALDLTSVLKDVTPQNFKARKAAIWKGAKDAADPMLNPAAKAAGPGGHGPDDIAMRLLDMIEGQSAADPVPDVAPAAVAAPAAAAAPPAAAATAPNSAVPAKPDDKNKKVMDALRAKGMSEDDISEIGSMMGGEPAEDEDDPKMKPEVTKAAMDEAIKSAVAETNAANRAKAEAIEIARPFVGVVSPLAHDSAEAVLRATLGTLGVDHKDLPAEALKPLLLKLPKPGSTTTPKPALAMDAKAAEGYAGRWANAQRISHA